MTDQAALANGLDETHAPRLRSWVPEANGHPEFPIQNLPLGVFSPPGGTPRIGTAIGDQVLDLAGLLEAGFLTGAAADAVRAAANGSLNGLLALGAGPRKALRARLSELLREGAPERDQLAPLLSKLADCTLHLPARIGDYTDFYVGIHHATEVGKLFRPDNPLLPNYKYVPIGYHGRASSIRPSGTPVRRPNGQTKAPDAAAPVFGPSRRLDYELELGIWVGPGNEQGEPVPVAEAADHIAGFCLLNDWSARDVQAWEYQPLGPFLSKNFATSLSPWVVTMEALAPFRVPARARPAGDPAPLPYLSDAGDVALGGLDLVLEAWLLTPKMRAAGTSPHRLSSGNFRQMYWTLGQLLTHHASNGCNLQPGDLLGSGTVSGEAEDSRGCLLELTTRGAAPVKLPGGESRVFLEDGDEVILRGYAARPGARRIGLGECRGVVLPAVGKNDSANQP